MENPYKTPQSQVLDLTIEKTPTPLQKVINLILFAFGLSVLQIVIYLGFDPEAFAEDEFSEGLFWVFLVMLLLFMALIFFLYYYLCLYRPVKQRKRSAAQWLFWANTIMLMFSIYTEYALNTVPEREMSILELVIYAVEVAIVYYAAYLLTRPECKVHLVN